MSKICILNININMKYNNVLNFYFLFFLMYQNILCKKTFRRDLDPMDSFSDWPYIYLFKQKNYTKHKNSENRNFFF